MAKRCASAAILETLRDPRVVTMAPAAQTVWIRILTAMQNSGISVLKFGSDIMNQTGIALFIQIAETEIETHLQTIIDRNLLARDADGAVSCPMLVSAATRAEINKINGSKGGRPRKDGAPPGQRALMLPINGGSEITKITETETKQVTEPAETPTYLLTESVKELEVSKSGSDDFASIGQAAFDAAGLDPARSMANFGIVKQWLADGADREMILDVVTRKTHRKVTTLNYFTAAIREEIAKKPKAKPAYEVAWERAYEKWELLGVGFQPMPKLSDFKERYAA
jgi:hypothetical protein